MKKTKLLTPIIAVATLGSVAPIVTLASCGNNSSNISLDDATQQSTTTSANVTTKAYTFSVSNYDATNDEIVAEIEDEESKTDVQVEIVNTYYDEETKKLVVVVSVSKSEGTLTESEEISFSINFKCIKKETKAQKWASKINKFLIKHHIGEEDQHFSDLDTTKVVKVTTKEAGKVLFSFDPTDAWDSSEGALKPSNLSVAAVSHFPGFESGIFVDNEVKTEFVDNKLNVEVSFDTTLAKRYGAFATFGLVFGYYDETNPDTAFVQTIGGFAIKYVETLEDDHIEMISSRERHYYKAVTDEEQSSTNYFGFKIVDDKTYEASDFAVSSNNELLTFGSVELATVEDESFLIIPYSIKKQSQDPYAHEPDLFNVSITIESKQEDNTWTKTIRGFNFVNISYLPVISYDSAKYAKAVFKYNGETTLTDIFETISPYVLTDLWMSSVTIEGLTKDKQPTVTMSAFSYEGTEIKIDTTSCGLTKDQSYNVTYSFYLRTSCTAFKYQLTKETKFVEVQ